MIYYKIYIKYKTNNNLEIRYIKNVLNSYLALIKLFKVILLYYLSIKISFLLINNFICLVILINKYLFIYYDSNIAY